MVFRIYVTYTGKNNTVDADVLRSLLSESFRNDSKSEKLALELSVGQDSKEQFPSEAKESSTDIPLILGLSLAVAFLLVLIAFTINV